MKQETPLQKLIAEMEEQANTCPISHRKFYIYCKTLAIQKLPYEREVIENYADKMRLIEDVDFDGNVTFAFDPKLYFEKQFKTE